MVYDDAVWLAWQARERQSVRQRDRERTGRSPASRSSGRAGRLARSGAACNLPNAGTCYADFNPAFSGPVRINGDYGDGDVLGANPPTYIDRNAFQSPARIHVRQHAADAGLRSAQPRLLQPGFEHPARLPDRRRARLGVGVDVFNVFNNVVFGGIQTNITNANFGRVSSQTNTPRVGQIKVRFDF